MITFCVHVMFIFQELHNQWNEVQEKLHDEVIIPLTAYQSQFPDIKVYYMYIITKVMHVLFYCHGRPSTSVKVDLE